ncbi:MAG: type IV pili twitching motility protein PilT, partial [Thermoleophilia bacterium]|nr:type IV pili twitching motility protein PilT [Thermoleophilia bacterium]
MPFRVDDALRHVVESDGSDLHLKVGAPPLIRVHGALSAIPGAEKLSPDDTEEALRTLVGTLPARAEFDDEGEADFSYSIPRLSRFRV